VFRFPEVHPDAECRIEFERTLRIPDDNRVHDLPASLGAFPLQHVEDHAARLPPEWVRHGGVLLPMYQAEAMWISFFRARYGSYPFAIRIAAGKVNAISGKPWRNALRGRGRRRGTQDYVVIPDQMWLDGFCVNEGLIRQFVAMPLGEGFTAEEQVSGEAVHGGLQIVVYPMKAARYEEMLEARRTESSRSVRRMSRESSDSMGLAPGGLMRQRIDPDKYGPDAWETSASSRCFVHILNSESWQAATGSPPPTEPITAADYAEAGIPWFHYYDESAAALPGSAALAGMVSVGEMTLKKGGAPLDSAAPPPETPLVDLDPASLRPTHEQLYGR
jgi:hypothetical protein